MALLYNLTTRGLHGSLPFWRKAVEVTVRGKHFDVPEVVEEHARRKFGRLSHYLPLLEDATVEVDVSRERTKEPERRFVVRVTVNGGGVHLRAEERAARPEGAVDQAARVLTEQARRHKQRLYGRGRTTLPKEVTRRLADAEDSSEPEDEEPDLLRKIARVKRFPMKPMTIEEALEQIEILGYDFVLFFDSDAREFSLLYKRQAGDYGLIIGELA